MLMRPNKAETAVHDCHCPGFMVVRMRKVLASGSISDIELALERCSSNWKNPSNFLQNHFKYALKLRGQHLTAYIRLSGIVHLKIITVLLMKQCTHFFDGRE